MRTQRVALSFDDGPDPVWTPAVLAALAGAEAHATFFVIGAAVERWPHLTRAVLAAGHDVQLHCHEHHRHTELSASALVADADRGLAALARLSVSPTRWRTPWGVLGPDSAAVAAERDLILTGWTADTEDWAGEPWPVLLERVAGGLHPGAVILAHDGLGPGATRTGCAETAELVGPLAAAIRAAGLEPGPVLGSEFEAVPPGAPMSVDAWTRREAPC